MSYVKRAGTTKIKPENTQRCPNSTPTATATPKNAPEPPIYPFFIFNYHTACATNSPRIANVVRQTY